MQFLRILFWVILAVVGVIFAFNNWQVVSVRLWSDLVLDSPLPMLLLVAFLLGLIPGLVLHRATRWSLRRKLEAVTRAQFGVGEPVAPPPPVAPSPAFAAGSSLAEPVPRPVEPSSRLADRPQ